jgi:Lon protease-like protein
MELNLFPLNSVLFPFQVLPLQIFEPRYLVMIEQCYYEKKPFGVSLIDEGHEVGAPAIPYKIGTEAQIKTFKKLQDNLFFIMVEGQRRFRIKRLLQEQPHIRVEIEWIDQLDLKFSGNFQLLSYILENFWAKTPPQAKAMAPKDFQLPTKQEEMICFAAALLSNDPLKKQEILEMSANAFVDEITHAIEDITERMDE